MMIPNDFIDEWQSIVDLIVRLAKARVGLIMRLNVDQIEVLVSSQTLNNPYHVGDREPLYGSGKEKSLRISTFCSLALLGMWVKLCGFPKTTGLTPCTIPHTLESPSSEAGRPV